MKYEMKLSAATGGGFNYHILYGPTIIGGGHRMDEKDARSAGLDDLDIARSFRVAGTEKTDD